MPRQRRYCPAGLPVHIIQRGNNKQVCFTSDNDMAAYANWLRIAAEKYDLAVHAWVFMTNHIHLLVTPATDILNSTQFVPDWFKTPLITSGPATGRMLLVSQYKCGHPIKSTWLWEATRDKG